MIKDIVKDRFLLSVKATEATKDDLYIVDDLLDTIKSYKGYCVGMAANMIGKPKRIMVMEDQGKYYVLINPEIIKASGNRYKASEGCLCHEDSKETYRYPKIKVTYLDEHWKKKIKTFEGLVAQTIQHEMDHFEGILI